MTVYAALVDTNGWTIEIPFFRKGFCCSLTYFDPRKQIILQVDALLKGLGATLVQEHRPVAFASK